MIRTLIVVASSQSVSTDIPAVGHCNRVQVETLGCYGYSTIATPPNTSNPVFHYYSASYVTIVVPIVIRTLVLLPTVITASIQWVNYLGE